MAKKKRPSDESLSLHPMTPEIALRRALNTPPPKAGPSVIRCVACGKPIASPKALQFKKGRPHHRSLCPKP